MTRLLCKDPGRLQRQTLKRLGISCQNHTAVKPIETTPVAPVKQKSFKWTAIEARKHYGDACIVCGWDDDTCDVHHIHPRKEGGSDELTNLAVLCPNHHRGADRGKISREELSLLARAAARVQRSRSESTEGLRRVASAPGVSPVRESAAPEAASARTGHRDSYVRIAGSDTVAA